MSYLRVAHSKRHSRQRQILWLALLAIGALDFTAFPRPNNTDAASDHARQPFIHGDLARSQEEAEQGYRRFSRVSPEWAWKFRILQAESLLWRGRYPDVISLPGSATPPPKSNDTSVGVDTLQAIASARQLDLETANRRFEEVERLCEAAATPACGEAFQGGGRVALCVNQLSEDRINFERILSFARSNGDRFLEATSLLNMGAVSLREEHFDETIDLSDASYHIARAVDAADVTLVAVGNVGWAYYKLGDYEKALRPLLEAEQRASQLGDVFSQENNLTNIGYVDMANGDFEKAERSFRSSLELARAQNSKEHMLNALRVLARLAVQTDDLVKASQYAEQALNIARESGNRIDELYPTLVQGQVAARRGDAEGAKNKFHKVEQDESCPVFLKWEAEHSLARLYEGESRLDSADRAYHAALATFEGARDTVRHEDFQLAFLTNASHIYDDYIHFLVARGKTSAALEWADFSRARTLSEGLGLLAKGGSTGPPPLDAQEIAKRANSTVLFYWLGERSYY